MKKRIAAIILGTLMLGSTGLVGIIKANHNIQIVNFHAGCRLNWEDAILWYQWTVRPLASDAYYWTGSSLYEGILIMNECEAP